MSFIDLGDCKLYCTDQGSGKPVIFVHGIPTDYRTWSAQVDTFSREFRTITYSRRFASPNTNSGDPSEGTVEQNTADLAMLMRRLGLSSAKLIGHSYGGFISLYLAATTPRLVDSLVLVEPAVPTVLVKNMGTRLGALSFFLDSPLVALSAFRFQKNALNPALTALKNGERNVAAKLFIDGLQGPAGFYSMGLLSAMLVDNASTIKELATNLPPVTYDVAKEIKTHALLIYGERTQPWLLAIAKSLAKAMPNAELMKIENTAHFPHIENPKRFNEVVMSYLRKH